MNNSCDYKTFPTFASKTEMFQLHELKQCIIYEDSHLLVLNKPGWIVCHPSKQGPLSSLIGSAREYTRLNTLYLINRLDRETSGLVVVAKNKNYARILQSAIENRYVAKTYYAIVEGLINL
jgi:23S rRNA pseudouridine1911/1915/1917 synthase